MSYTFLPQPQKKSFIVHPFFLAAVILSYLFVGIIGHDPWRGSDLLHFGSMLELLQHKWTFNPNIASAPHLPFGPLYYWVSAFMAQTFSPWLALHDAGRLATPFFAIISLLFLARTTTRLYGKQTLIVGPLLFIGTLGLLIHIHTYQPMSAFIAAQSIAFYGICSLSKRPIYGAFMATIGVSASFFSLGLTGLWLTLPLLPIVIIFCPIYHQPRIISEMLISLTIVATLCGIWLIMLRQSQDNAFNIWWQIQWHGLHASLPTLSELSSLSKMMAWFLWPIWPIAIWQLCKLYKRRYSVGFVLPFSAILLALPWLLSTNHHPYQEPLLVFILPLILPASSITTNLQRSTTSSFNWFACLNCLVFTIFVWLGWTAQVFNLPKGLARSLVRMSPDYIPKFSLLQISLALLIFLLWLILVFKTPRSNQRPAINWATGITLLWISAVIFLQPWFNHVLSYQPVISSLLATLQNQPKDCITYINLEADHLAAFNYYSNLKLLSANQDTTNCHYVLLHSEKDYPELQMNASWMLLWEYRHAGGKRLEIFRLYQYPAKHQKDIPLY